MIEAPGLAAVEAGVRKASRLREQAEAYREEAAVLRDEADWSEKEADRLCAEAAELGRCVTDALDGLELADAERFAARRDPRQMRLGDARAGR